MHLAAILQNGDLAAGLVVDRQLNEPHRVHVLDLTPRAQMAKVLRGLIFLILPRTADRHVHVRPQVAVLHVAVAGAQIAQDLAQFGDIGRRLLGAAQVGAADDFHQGHAGAVEIDETHRRVHVMNGFAGVLFKVNPLDPHQTRDAGRQVNQHLAHSHDGMVKLADLIALRQVGVEIVLAVKGRGQVDLRLQAQPGAHRLFNAKLVDHRQHPRHRGIDEGDVRIRLGPDLCGRPREQFGPAGDLGVNLHPDHQFPIALRPGNDFRFRGGIGQVEHGNLRAVRGLLGKGGRQGKRPALQSPHLQSPRLQSPCIRCAISPRSRLRFGVARMRASSPLIIA